MFNPQTICMALGLCVEYERWICYAEHATSKRVVYIIPNRERMNISLCSIYAASSLAVSNSNRIYEQCTCSVRRTYYARHKWKCSHQNFHIECGTEINIDHFGVEDNRLIEYGVRRWWCFRFIFIFFFSLFFLIWSEAKNMLSRFITVAVLVNPEIQ